jgi:amino acid permease
MRHGKTASDCLDKLIAFLMFIYLCVYCSVGAAAYANVKELIDTCISLAQRPNLGQGRVI